MTFETAVEHILRFEGDDKITEDPRDPGGVTKFGISQRSYPSLNIRSLNRAGAIALYRRDFWDRIFVSKLPEEIRLVVFDAAVNQGPATAIKMLQACVDVPQDGLVGPKTIAACELVSPIDLICRICHLRLDRYLKNSNFGIYGRGWVFRVVDIAILSIGAPHV